MLNVANGNVLVQDDDVDIPERGIDLAFRRTYNSQSGHDYAGSDGSTMSNYGNGWTNTFDAHLAFDSVHNVLSVYDINGTRYDYAASGTTWTPPAGMQGTKLESDGSCGYYWTKKNGSMYYFWSPNYGSCAGAQYTGYNGRLYMIYGRNHNNWVRFDYSWLNSDSSSGANITQINAVHADGQTLQLHFALVANAYTLLTSIVRPDGQTIHYAYDSSANLTDVCRPGNGNVDNSPNAASICGDTSHIHHRYGWNANHQMAWADSPRWTMYWGNAGSDGSGGSYVSFSYDASNRMTGATVHGYGNFAPNDGTGALLQPSLAQGAQQLSTMSFGYSTGETQASDYEGHATNWYIDSAGRVIRTQEWTGAPNNVWLTTTAVWDANDNLTETTDARGYPTDYAYDQNGNTTMVALPQETTANGTFRPTSLYSYDSLNNITAYCDPIQSHTLGKDFNVIGAVNNNDGLCPSSAGASRFSWEYPSTETYGRLTDIYSAAWGSGNTSDPGYHSKIFYDPNAQAGVDAGLPTMVAGDGFTQADNSTIHPVRRYTYDAEGNLICFSSFEGDGAPHWQIEQYDSLNRVSVIADPDDATITNGQCAKSGTIAGSRIVTTKQYFGNGQLSSTQTPGQYAAGVSSSFTYDADENKLTETHHYAGVATTYTMWYDGVGRLVEVKKPADTRAINGMHVDYTGNAWLTRYLYGLSGTTSVSFGNISTVNAHGDLFKTQEYGGSSTNAWVDTKGTSYDALDRAIAKLYYAPGDDQTVRQDTLVYDNTAANDGYLGTRTNALGQQQIFSYTPEGKPQQITFAGDGGATPARSYTYDADGRSAGVSSTLYGTKSLTYDTDGRLISEQEPSGGNLTSPATLNYTYYPNGLKRGISVSSSSLSQTDMELYAYRADGRISWQQFSYAGKAYAQTIGYTPGGRPTSMSDSYLANAYQFSYDTTGRINAYTIPSATFSNMTYDPEDEVTAFNGYGTNVTYNYSSRGEFVGKTFANDPCSSTTGTLQRNGSQQQLSNGVALPVGWNSQTCAYENIGANSDFPSGALLASHNNPGDYQYFDFDIAGRENEVQTMTPCTGSADKCSDPTATSEDDVYKSYDAEDHLVSTGTSATSQPTSFGWGPGGHPVRVATTTGAIDMYSDTALTIHWDGNSVLFVTAQDGTLRDIKFGSAAVMVPNSTTYSGITAIDRDWSGENIAAHNSTGHTQASGSDGYAFQPYPSQQGSFIMDDLSEVSEPREDGVRILSGEGGAIFQGVRSYDSASQQWMSRDALSGELHDPITQKAYVWNLNNPITYSDPSGYEGCVTSQCMQQWQAGSRAAGDAAYRVANWLIGDQVRTLEDPHSTLGQKVLAGLLIASSVPGLEEGVAAKGIAVIGHYTAGYIDVAKSLNASHFDLGKEAWNILNRISPEIPEALNLKFLQDMAAKGTPFLVVTGPDGVEEGSWLQWEIDQLRKMGYDWDASHHWLLPPGPAKP